MNTMCIHSFLMQQINHGTEIGLLGYLSEYLQKAMCGTLPGDSEDSD